MNGFIQKITSITLLTLVLCSSAQSKTPANQTSPLGMNTNEALEVDASIPFIDLFRLSLPFDEAFHREWQRAMRETTALSLIFIDIDHFKQYNDFYGHLAGDDCLKEVAQGLMQVFKRPTDLFARYGGEEFVALLPNTDAMGAVYIAEKLRLQTMALKLEHEKSSTADCITISLGIVTTIPMVKHQPRKFAHMADEALYEAKQQGRNQTVCKSI
ncbi:MAG TPA: GGDEF domain-containing protein [Ghiorsea sp.]|nr:GGDEF domain-containing protein [Ghiorsea sp.]